MEPLLEQIEQQIGQLLEQIEQLRRENARLRADQTRFDKHIGELRERQAEARTRLLALGNRWRLLL